MTTTHLSAEELKILPKELEALLWVRNALATDTMPAWLRFDMTSWGGVHANETLGCGTACCIGGSMEMHMAGLTALPEDHVVTDEDWSAVAYAFDNAQREAGREPVTTTSDGNSPPLYALFFNYFSEKIDSDTRWGAIKAIDNFLAGNVEDPWETGEVV